MLRDRARSPHRSVCPSGLKLDPKTKKWVPKGAYDPNGNQTQAGIRSFTYDAANRLSSTTASGTTASYAYDGDGLRLRASTG
ncbi:MAG: hypothetical protein ACRDRU_24310, partial [Pseudonocardiaceae bacterium]